MAIPIEDSEKERKVKILDEIPVDPTKVSQEMLLRLPSTYGIMLWLREGAKTQLQSLLRARKSERARLSNSCLNPVDEVRPISKTTERAVDAYVESQPSVIDLNAKYDQAKSEVEYLNAVCETLKTYNFNLNTYFKSFARDEQTTPNTTINI